MSAKITTLKRDKHGNYKTKKEKVESISVCPICLKKMSGKDTRKIDGRVNVKLSPEYCETCTKDMKENVIVIGVKDGTATTTPERTGELLVVSEEDMAKIINPEANINLKETRLFLIEQSVIEKVFGKEHLNVDQQEKPE